MVRFSEKGFVFAPFDNEQKAILFPEESSEFISEELSFKVLNFKERAFSTADVSKEHHIQLVDKAIEEIIKNDLKKVVVSRKEVLEITEFNLIRIYQKLLQTYNNAFVYVWYHPKIGLWLGATPETLLDVENTIFKTMSLAGTQVYKGSLDVMWNKKELEEQQIVTNYIESNLNSLVDYLSISKPTTIKACNRR